VFVTVTLLIGAGVLSSCGRDESSSLPDPSTAFCKAARAYDNTLPKLTGKNRFTRQIELVKPMVDHAPDDIRDDAATFLDALERRSEGDTSVAKDKSIQRAIERVNRRAAQGCGFYESDPGRGI
jgi:hypothetical protein